MKRREFLTGLSIFGGLSVIALWDDSPTHTDSAAALETLADEINHGSVAEPHQIPYLARTIEDAIDTAETGIHSTSTARARRNANKIYKLQDRLSVLPFISAPEKPQIETEITAINAALDYYHSVLDMLNAAKPLYYYLEDVDLEILDTTRELPAARNHSSLFDQLDTALSNLTAETEQVSDDTPQLSRLLPNHTILQEESQQLKQLYTMYADVQNRFLEASLLIQEGAMHRENQELQHARDTFETATSRATLETPHDVDGSLSAYSLSINDYQAVLDAYQAGAAMLVESCNSDLEVAELRQRYSTGLDRLFDAQEIIASA